MPILPWAQDACSARDERGNQSGEPLRLLQIHAMSAILDDLELGVWQRREVAIGRRDGDDPVFVAPSNESRYFHTRQEVRQGLAVHVGLPGDAEAHLARDVPRLELIGRWCGAVDLIERTLIIETRTGIVDVADDSLVKNIALRRLDAHW